MSSAIAIIPARGGSKRIPRKNIRTFHGKPIIAYSIEAALESRCFDRVVVSTDDEEIATVARQFGAEIPFIRPASLSDDHTGTMDVMRHALDCVEKEGAPADLACCIHATAPFLQVRTLKEGLAKLLSTSHSYAFSVTTFGFPIQRALRINTSGSLDSIWPEHRFTRSQDLEVAYHDAGQFYWGRAAAFKENRLMSSPESVGLILPRFLVHDLDTEEDWRTAEVAYEVLVASGVLSLSQ